MCHHCDNVITSGSSRVRNTIEADSTVLSAGRNPFLIKEGLKAETVPHLAYIEALILLSKGKAMDHRDMLHSGDESQPLRRVSVSDENSGGGGVGVSDSASNVGNVVSLSQPQFNALIAQCVSAAVAGLGQFREAGVSGSADSMAGPSGVQTPRLNRQGSLHCVSSDEESVSVRSHASVVSGIPESIGPADRDGGFEVELSDLVNAQSALPIASDSGHKSVNDLVTEDWGALYNTDEKFGPPVNEVLAKLVNTYVRSRPGDEQLRKAQADVLIPENCKGLTVPLLNQDFVGLFAYKHGMFMERQLCRQIGLNCKAVGPLVQLLDAWQKNPDLPVERDLMKGVSDSVRLLISNINLQNFTRKQNVMNCVRDPHLKPLCDWATPVAETLFPADVSEQVAAVKKKYKIAAGGSGSQKGAKRQRRDFVHSSQRGGAKGQSQKDNSSSGAKKPSQEKPFLAKGSKGKGKSS